MKERQPVVAVIGGGLSGTLVTVNLLRYAARPLRVVLIERSGDFGPGVAYSTTDPQHRLNVPAARMSAFQGAPLHLLTWAARRLERKLDGSEYLPRAVYGDYLRALLAEEQKRARAAEVELVAATAERIERAEAGVRVELGDGSALQADAAVLATGNLPPVPPPGLPDDPRIVKNPWAPGALKGLTAAQTTVLIGTSLTAVDVALTVAQLAPGGRTIAISRSGLLPHTNLPGLREPAPEPNLPPSRMPLVAVDHFLRSYARRMVASHGYDWRDAVDGIRPCVPAFWRALTIEDRRRFVAEMARPWDVRRHRMAPDSNIELEWLRQAGRLKFEKASLAGAVAKEDHIELLLDGETGRRRVRAGQVVCCTGVGTDVRRAGGLIGNALDEGVAVADPLGLGLQAGSCGALIDPRTGSAQGPIYTLGPPLRGELWETTAAREISIQAEDIAIHLCRGLNITPPTAGETEPQSAF